MKPQSLLITLVPALVSGSIALGAANFSKSDSAWLQYIVGDSNGEIKECQLADAKTKDPSVHALCARAIADHTKASERGTQLAKQLDVSVSQSAPLKSVEALNKLRAKSGAAFVADFKKGQIKDHQKDIQRTEKAIPQSKNMQVKSLEEQTLAALKVHLQLAQQIH